MCIAVWTGLELVQSEHCVFGTCGTLMQLGKHHTASTKRQIGTGLSCVREN